MAVSAKCNAVTKAANGTVYFDFADGTQLEFANIAQAKEAIAMLDSDRATAQLMLIAWWFARSADGSNENLVEGKTLTYDLSAANPIRVQ